MSRFTAAAPLPLGLSPVVPRWLLGLLTVPLMLWALGSLSGCASTGASAASATAEPITAFDEPEVRKRARIRLELASNYFEQGQTTIALDEIKQSLAADPSYTPAYVLRGLVYMRLNNPALAEDSFQRALQISPRDGDTLHNYGWFHCEAGRYPQALALFDRALASPTYGAVARTHLVKGICQIRAGQPAEAEASFSKSYELDAGNPITGYNLAALLFQRGEDSRAQFYIRRINNSNLANAETLWLGIKIERRLRNTVEVEQLARQLGRRFAESRQWALYQRGAFDE
ncbi:type IV pilus biogenesis/stability protein PilW [Hydrogenophaga sp.]|uniref:type IV pilus biogenesis/stability protein PilW n=1 Tax=Hydrogenophaga sp. TaxID=1904254 RepID=UPI002618CBE4|nr:type IV pilus biogenesis/stability protein PilW [Hydrogenophaga sp.]MDM7950464.1 type IV pilus biogenesis/stability protein PilW [Hydrogenophaga sp.]